MFYGLLRQNRTYQTMIVCMSQQEDSMATIAEAFLKEIMEIQNLRQVDLVRLAEPVGETNGLHIRQKAISSQYVSGRTRPRRDILKVLAEALGVSQLWLQGEDVPMKSAEKQAGVTTDTGSAVGCCLGSKWCPAFHGIPQSWMMPCDDVQGSSCG